MTDYLKNKPASIRQKLLNHARSNNIDFNMILIHYFNERILYRLSKSKYFDNFILKGALLLLASDISLIRPTKDIDFLGININNDIEAIAKIFAEIINIECDDGIVFYPDKVDGESINDFDQYNGVRIKIEGFLDTARQRIQIDIGFGDTIFPDPVIIDFPTILEFDSPIIRAYSYETVISEKFEAIVSLGLSNSCMKDFYDILYLASKHKFNSRILKLSINETFIRRKSNIADFKYVFNSSFKNDPEKQILWKVFMTRTNLQIEQDFSQIINKIEMFLKPIFNFSNDMYWDSDSFKWVNQRITE